MTTAIVLSSAPNVLCLATECLLPIVAEDESSQYRRLPRAAEVTIIPKVKGEQGAYNGIITAASCRRSMTPYFHLIDSQ